jgi:hypothetical protein
MLYESITKGFPVTWAANLDILSKYTRRERKTSLVVGQYLWMRRRYASRVIVGMLRAWKDKDDEAFPKEDFEAVVRVFHTGDDD